MLSFIQRLFSNPVLPLIWTLLTIVLLCLPGSAVRKSRLLDLEFIDELAHIVLFGGVVLTWGIYLILRSYFEGVVRISFLLVIAASALGVLLEYVQLTLIPQRGFELLDIVINTCAALVAGALLVLWAATLKNNGPCGNRGRNQN